MKKHTPLLRIAKRLKEIAFLFLCVILLLGSCDYSSDISSDSGEGGSMNRFTIVGDYLYVVDNAKLKVFDVSDSREPSLLNKLKVGSEIETLFAADDMLFIGSRSGMYIYSIADPTNPEYLSETVHVYNCDPVVADGDYAYVTLSDGTGCDRWENELQIVDIRDPENTEVVEIYSMDQPKGLDIKGDLLFVCDKDELVVFNKSNAPSLKELYDIPVSANDVIALDSLLLVITDKSLYQYSYTASGYSCLSTVYAIE